MLQSQIQGVTDKKQTLINLYITDFLQKEQIH